MSLKNIDFILMFYHKIIDFIILIRYNNMYLLNMIYIHLILKKNNDWGRVILVSKCLSKL